MGWKNYQEDTNYIHLNHHYLDQPIVVHKFFPFYVSLYPLNYCPKF